MARKKKPKPLDDDDFDERPKKKSKKSRPRDDFDDELDERPRGTPPDAYTGLALVTLIALLGAAAFFYLDAEAVKAQPLSPPSVTVPALAPGAPNPT